MMTNYSLIAAVGTPLTENESLDVPSLEMHLQDQWDGGMTGVLVGGTMGAMQLLRDDTYEALIEHAVVSSGGRGEVMVGVGDASLARTKDRIAVVNKTHCDGVVVLSPYLFRFTQEQLVGYFTELANYSNKPLYLYDLPGLTGVKLELATVQRLAEHPNIRGIKCSGEFGWTRQLIDCHLRDFRVIVAQADLIDVLMHHGVREHLDGVFAMAPRWTAAIADAAAREQWDEAAVRQQQLSSALTVLKTYGVFPTFSAIMNARGFPGSFAPQPFQPLDDETRQRVLDLPIIQQLVAECPAPQRLDGTKRVARVARHARRVTGARFSAVPDGKADGKADEKPKRKSTAKLKPARRL